MLMSYFPKNPLSVGKKKNLITGILKINIFYKFPNTFLLLLKEPLKTENLKFKIKKNYCWLLKRAKLLAFTLGKEKAK